MLSLKLLLFVLLQFSLFGALSKKKWNITAKNWLHQYEQGRRTHEVDKWTTPQERKNCNNTNNNNFKDNILKTNYFKQQF
jgi:hypothetical protein